MLNALRQRRTPSGVAGTPLLIVLALAQFMVVLDFTIVNVALPSIQAGLHIGTSTLQWLVSGYAGFSFTTQMDPNLVGTSSYYNAYQSYERGQA